MCFMTYTCTWGYRTLPQPCSFSCIQPDEAPQGCVAAVVHWESARSGVEPHLPQPDFCLRHTHKDGNIVFIKCSNCHPEILRAQKSNCDFPFQAQIHQFPIIAGAVSVAGEGGVTPGRSCLLIAVAESSNPSLKLYLSPDSELPDAHVFNLKPSQTSSKPADLVAITIKSKLSTANHGDILNRGNSVCSVMSNERDPRHVGTLGSPARHQVCPFIQIHNSSRDSQSVINATWGILRHSCPPDAQSQQ